MSKVILLFSSLLSCMLVVSLMFQFWNDRYERKYRSRWVYILAACANVAVVTATNMLMKPLLNLFANVLMLGLICCFLYEEGHFRKVSRFLESAALFTLISLAEAVGVYLIDCLLRLLSITPENEEILLSVESTFSIIVILFFYYLFYVRLWRKRLTRTPSQYALYAILFLYGVINVLITAVISQEEHPAVLLIIMVSIISANLLLLYFMKYLDERNFYKLQVGMMEQQQKLQFENYAKQREKYSTAMSVIHDVNKHITMIEDLYREDQKEEALSYTKQINDMLKPLAPVSIVNNPILNCLLSDKLKTAKLSEIEMVVDISPVADVSFMESVDITTLFGNLLDNAIAACEKCDSGRHIRFYLREHNQMLLIEVENSVCRPVSLREGYIVQSQRGIGLLNIQKCVDTYQGSINYENKEKALLCRVLLNNTVE